MPLRSCVGPFEWVPNENVYGHDCVLMIASVAGDPSNVDNFTGERDDPGVAARPE